MIRKREDLEKMEDRILASYAVKSSDLAAINRIFPDPKAKDRTAFQRDRDRILYSKAFMRLKGKTQVVLANHGDHFRTRLTHTMYVAAVSRDVARQLGLNEDLAEAIALAHDLGHTCFGHEGESALHEKMKKYDSRFEHNEQSLWVVEHLAKESRRYSGLNLTSAVLDGLDKHRTVYDNPQSRDSKLPSLEAQIVNTADEIAYRYHDLDDGLRAGVFTVDDLNSLSIWNIAKEHLLSGENNFVSKTLSQVMTLMIDDLVHNTDARILSFSITSSEDVYAASEHIASFSDDMREIVKELSDFLFKRFYKSDKVKRYNDQGRKIITFLFEYFYDHPEFMPTPFSERLKKEKLHIVVKDYVAGMTDGYATNLFDKLNQ